uniref:Circadian clock protein regulator n=1 Tax=Arthrospira sp. PCC 9901 TaxID=478446 RepID=A0A3G2BBJ7_9CYAN|nr:circadian clock protein regulator [Arthrospira sp. PCC 9901]
MVNSNPKSEPNKRNLISVQKIRTMIEGFDDISHGGMPAGRSTLVSGT